MDMVFFIASKPIGALLRPDTWIIIALGLIVLALLTQRRSIALWISSVTLAALFGLAILPLGDLLLRPIEQTYPAHPHLERVDVIIVLGGGEDARAGAYWGQIQLNDGGERYTAALELARQFPEARVLFTGGSGALRGRRHQRPTWRASSFVIRASRPIACCSKANLEILPRMRVLYQGRRSLIHFCPISGPD